MAKGGSGSGRKGGGGGGNARSQLSGLQNQLRDQSQQQENIYAEIRRIGANDPRAERLLQQAFLLGQSKIDTELQIDRINRSLAPSQPSSSNPSNRLAGARIRGL